MSDTEITPASMRFSAMNLLAMREHSVVELEKKLQQKYNGVESVNDQTLITNVIAKLTADGLQSDARFTEAFIKMRQGQGKGPLLINMQLKERGISSDIVAAFMNLSDEIWNQIAAKAYIKKCANRIDHSLKQTAKHIGFLTARGFSTANIQFAINNAKKIEHEV
jgi:regulatory protein